jgi:MFS transporter, DHA3 family, macrolide efflux protein
MATAPKPRPSMKDAFALPGFRKLWLAQFVSIFGDFLALFGVISLITFRWHGSVMHVTYVSIAYMAPLAIVGPVAGVFVDRWNVKRVMIASDAIRAVLALLLVWVTDIRQVSAVLFAISCVSSFFGPSQSVTVRTLVPMDKMMAAQALMAQAFYTVRLLSPALAGTLISLLTEKACFYLDAASFAFSAIMLSTIVIAHTPPVQGQRTLRSFFADFTSGNRFIFTHPSLAFVITAMVSAMFVMSCFSPLISIYVRDTLHAGPFQFGIVSTMVGVGLIVGTQLITRIAGNRSKKEIVLWGLLAASVGVGLLGTFKVYAAAVACTFGIGFGFAFVIVSAQTLMQQETPREMLGRVSSSFMSVFSCAQVFGLLLSGKLALWLSVRQVFQLCAAVLLLLTLAGFLRHQSTSNADSAPASAD